MSDIIRLLPDNIANQIAAGEVIQRPASVVKELVENAIDAGATQIKVNIKDAGKTLVQVIDNGKGMSETDARMSFERHATSKISKAEDLFSLHTMGFRGEALASIAAVAQVELRTRMKGAELGTKLEIDGSHLQEIEEEACPEGSIFSVKNLFYNVPARRKFLKSNETEFRNIINEFERIALVNPKISFFLLHNDVEIFNLPESGLRQRIINIYGKGLNQKLLPLDSDTSLTSISGFVSRPDAARKRGALQFFFVNGRFMRHAYFHKAVMQAYEHLIPSGEMPNYFIYFNLDPSAIDVNIHPTKTEIKFENEQPIWQILHAAVRESLAKSSAIPTIDFNTDDNIDIPVYNPKNAVTGVGSPKIDVNSNYNPFREEVKHPDKSPAFDWNELYNNFESERKYASSEGADAVVEKSLGTTDVGISDPTDISFLPNNMLLGSSAAEQSVVVTPCFQYKNRYIITALKSGMAIVDQHRAHIRILYERYMKSIRQKQNASQQMLFPAMVDFTPAEESVLPNILQDLNFAGFDLSNMGGGSYAINGVPAGMEGVDCVSLLKDIVEKIMESGGKVNEEVAGIIAFSLASAQAIPYGKPLVYEEMDHLLASLFICSDMNLTPDGKTIYTLLTDNELETRFR